MTPQQAGVSAEALAQRFHYLYESLAPQFGYETRKDSAVAWEKVPEKVPEKNRKLMIAVCEQLLATAPPEQADDFPGLPFGTVQEMLKQQREADPPQPASAGALPTEIDIVKRILSAHQTAYAQAHNTEGCNVIESDNIAIGCASVELAKQLAAHDQKVREPLAAWMIANSFATGHGDTVEDLLKELKWQIEERNQKVREQALEEAAMLVEASKISSERIRIARSIRALAPAPATSKPEAAK